MAEKTTPEASFRFKGMEVIDSRITVHAPGQYHFNIAFEPSGVFDKNQNTFTLYLNTKITEKEERILIEVSTRSVFEYSETDDTNMLMEYFTGNAPAIVFPYIRSYISALTALSGMQTITMPTLNMSAISKTIAEHIRVIEKT